jgi:dipeptidyl aminopeptidase/acylaminoacyl peptidase
MSRLRDKILRSLVLALAAASCVGISLAPGQTPITRPVVSDQACPAEVLAVPTRDGHQATAVVRKPPGQGPFPALIHLHGGLESSTADRLKEFLKGQTPSRFLAAGYVTVAATFRSRATDPQTRAALWDCLAIIDHVKKRPEVDPKSIVLWGDSGGGSLALELAGETPLCAIAVQEPATVLFTGLFNKANLEGKPPYTAQSGLHLMEDPQRFYTPQWQKHTREKIGKISCPVFIAQGDVHLINKINNEIFIPELKKAGKTVEVVLYPGEKHGFSHRGTTGAKKFFEDSHAFFQRHLPTPPAPLKGSLVKHVPLD